MGFDYLLQIVVTVWLGVDPITYTLPKLYPNNDHSCQDYAEALASKRKPDGPHMTIECVQTNGRDA